MSDDIVTRLREYDFMRDGDIPDVIMNKAADEIERLRGLMLVFDDHFVCEECEKACATYLQRCPNPLHALHTAAWEIR